jgi:phage tail-like protein
MSPTTRIDPFQAGNFMIEIEGIQASSFSEVSGLEAAVGVVDYRNGNVPENTAQKLPGMDRYTNVTLKRGLTQDFSLWNWFNSALTGSVVRAAVVITLRDQADNPVWVWKLQNAWPCRWSGPALVANSSEVAIESVEICHEGLVSLPPA